MRKGVQWLLYGLLLALLVSCATMSVAGECPESKDLRCLGKKVCTMDRERGCQVCQCEEPINMDKQWEDKDRSGDPMRRRP